MADFVSHHLFGRQALTVFPAPAQRAAACRPACFFWGCQGPDPLFYRKILLGSPLHKLGNRMHSEKTDELFAALSRAVRDLSGDAQERLVLNWPGILAEAQAICADPAACADELASAGVETDFPGMELGGVPDKLTALDAVLGAQGQPVK